MRDSDSLSVSDREGMTASCRFLPVIRLRKCMQSRKLRFPEFRMMDFGEQASRKSLCHRVGSFLAFHPGGFQSLFELL